MICAPPASAPPPRPRCTIKVLPDFMDNMNRAFFTVIAELYFFLSLERYRPYLMSPLYLSNISLFVDNLSLLGRGRWSQIPRVRINDFMAVPGKIHDKHVRGFFMKAGLSQAKIPQKMDRYGKSLSFSLSSWPSLSFSLCLCLCLPFSLSLFIFISSLCLSI